MSRLVTVAVVYDLPAALCLRSALESLDIPVFIDGIHHASVDWWITLAIGGMRVRVVENDAHTARDYLRNPALERATKPRISADIWRRPVGNAILLSLSMLLVSIPLWTRPRSGDG